MYDKTQTGTGKIPIHADVRVGVDKAKEGEDRSALTVYHIPIQTRKIIYSNNNTFDFRSDQVIIYDGNLRNYELPEDWVIESPSRLNTLYYKNEDFFELLKKYMAKEQLLEAEKFLLEILT